MIGILGKSGVGKSTIMSLLGGNNSEKNLLNNSVFKIANKDILEKAENGTNGINAFITTERTILLDVQVLDK